MTEATCRARLFLGSYVLLFVLLAIRFQEEPLEIGCGVIAAAGFLDMLWIVLHVSRQIAPDPIRVKEVTDAGPEVAGYIATYLLPFLTVPQPAGRDVAAYVVFLLITGLVYVRSEMTQVNPTLYILGRRVVAVTTDGGWSGHVVVRSSVRPGDIIHAVSLNPALRVQGRTRATEE
ncbi:MAG: hypothetical protein M0T72_11610 [Candidatus Dormibacteraeota bacterium]|nr:hypothetical protein [Candidatus Dormibacteraeota bacterium]